ncbi:stage V sporulation protein AA [Anaerolentibacter hominis]|uniref:stage V sporulation protein AA n=1 Tax=Anaerolentibacter hominis TaxID=3079009 RepID=UPI0031B87C2A
MKDDLVYIKIEQNIEVTNKKVFLQDIATLYSANTKMVNDLNKLVVAVIKSQEDVKHMYSVMKIVEMITKAYPNAEVINMGETDFVLSYKVPGKHKKWKEYLKTTFVCLTVFFGAAFTIMTFNADVSVADVFQKFYELVTGTAGSDYYIMEITYSIGLALGIIVFFNHFSKIRLHNDPTPIQIEMCNYEEDTNKALINRAEREGKKIDV